MAEKGRCTYGMVKIYDNKEGGGLGRTACAEGGDETPGKHCISATRCVL